MKLPRRRFLHLAAGAAGDLGQPDDGLDGFDLAEEGTNAFEIVVPPMRQQAHGRGRDAPIGRIRQVAPGRNLRTDFVDDRGWVVFLLDRRKAFIIAEYESFLLGLALRLARP